MNSKWTYLMFAAGGLLLAILLSKSFFWGWDFLSITDFAGDFVGKPNEVLIDLVSMLLAGVATWGALRNQRLFTLASEVTSELSKVTWPTAVETRTATIVVIVTVIVSSLFLGLFDLVWSTASRLIYG